MTAYVVGNSTKSASTAGATVRSALQALDPELPMYEVKMGEERVATQFSSQRVVARLATIMAGIGVFLCALGLFGLLSYAVTARVREFGIKIALGAHPQRMAQDVVKGGVRLTVLGLVVGLPVAWGVARLAAELYGVTVLDPLTYLLGGSLLVAVSLVAGTIPMRRATTISPVEALREE